MPAVYANRDETPIASQRRKPHSRRNKESQRWRQCMLKRILFFAYGSLSYLIFLGTFLYAICFIGNFGVPRTLDGEASGPLGVSFAIDTGLLALFAVQHSVMARKWFRIGGPRWCRGPSSA